MKLFKNGIAFVWHDSKVKFSIYFLSIVFLSIFCFRVFRVFLTYTSGFEANIVTYVVSSFLGLFLLAAIRRKRVSNYRDVELRLLLFVSRLLRNIVYSIKLLKERNRIGDPILKEKRSVQFDSKKKPNIHLLFIESYGSVLLKDEKLKEGYLKTLNSAFDTLKNNQWVGKSHLSKSISLVGPSWLAYTTALMGMKVENNFTYDYLLMNKDFHKYDNFLKIFQKQGYTTYNLNSMKPINGVLVPFDDMASLYGIDKWILRKDMTFTGTCYGISETAPDQYVLNFAKEEVLNKSSNPYVLFYLTKNSHTPYISPVNIEDNWKVLNNGTAKILGNSFLQMPKIEDYLSSIKYQVNMFTDFILKNGTKDDIFFIMGDHQPHGLANLDDHGTDTLVHVFSKNKEFVEGFDAYGFKDDIMKVDKPINHEAIYSIFLREFMRNFGINYEKLPDYEPDGI